MIKGLVKKALYPHSYSSEAYESYLRGKGVEIGKGCYFFDARTINIDLQRPHMLRFGDYVKVTGYVHILCHDYSRSVVLQSGGALRRGERDGHRRQRVHRDSLHRADGVPHRRRLDYRRRGSRLGNVARGLGYRGQSGTAGVHTGRVRREAREARARGSRGVCNHVQRTQRSVAQRWTDDQRIRLAVLASHRGDAARARGAFPS